MAALTRLRNRKYFLLGAGDSQLCIGHEHSGAVFSADRQYRYSLWRQWDRLLPLLAVIGLNPSTADELANDPTIRRCIAYARLWGFGGLLMLNLFAYRSTNPAQLLRVADPVGPGNDSALRNCVVPSSLTLAAWGVHGACLGRSQQVLALLRAQVDVYCLGLTKAGQPKHPLYLRADTWPELWLPRQPLVLAA